MNPPAFVADLHHLTCRGWSVRMTAQSVTASHDELGRLYEEFPPNAPGALQDALEYVITQALEIDGHR